MRKVCIALATVACLTLATPARATTIDFESFSDLDALSSQVAGLTFTDFTVLSAGISLNDFEYPPVSGSNVAAGLNGNSAISFTSAISSFSAYFTYASGLSLSFYDGSTLLQTISATLLDNTALSGSGTPNELLQFSAASITQVIVSGSGFTMDDLTYIPAGGNPPVPEPASALLLLTGIAIIGARYRARLFPRR